MKKPVNADVIANELREGSAFFRQAREQVDPEASQESTPRSTVAPVGRPVGHSTSQSTYRLTGQSTGQSTGQEARPATPAEETAFDTSVILGRPKSFYITERQDRELDVTVSKLQEKLNGRGNQKVDRSTVMRLLLEVNNITDDSTVDRLASQLVRRLVSQLTG